MTPTFNVADPTTWPMVMTIEQVAALYDRSVKSVRNYSNVGRFVPVPFLTRPYRWRKADVLRHVEGARGSSLRAVSR